MDFLEIHCSVKYVHVKKRRFAEVKDSETQTLSVTFEMRFEMVKKKTKSYFYYKWRYSIEMQYSNKS